MKFNARHFKFDTSPQRIKKSIMDEYDLIKEKKQKDDYDKMFIQMVRAKMKTTKMKLVGTHIPSGIQRAWVIDSAEYDTAKYIEMLVETVKLERMQKNRDYKREAKVFDGANYETQGGVFIKENSINALTKFLKTSDPTLPKKPKKANVNYIGIELEFNNDVEGQNTASIGKALKEAGLGKYVCVGTDVSCGFEVRVLLPDNDFIEPLTKITSVITNLGFHVDDRCGLHVHLDMRNRDVKKSYANLFKSMNLLKKFVNKKRLGNRFCVENGQSTYDDHNTLCAQTDRDTARRYSINTMSYSLYKTIEIRMHQGTLKPEILIPWIQLLLKIVNHEGILEKKVTTVGAARRHFKLEPDLAKDLLARIEAKGA